jgi:hypothetical protein
VNWEDAAAPKSGNLANTPSDGLALWE